MWQIIQLVNGAGISTCNLLEHESPLITTRPVSETAISEDRKMYLETPKKC